MNLLLALAVLFLVTRKRSVVGASTSATHWYKSTSDGGFEDMLDELAARGVTIARGTTPAMVTAKTLDSLVAIVHDVEGPVRATVLDSSLELPKLWPKLDALIKDALG